MKKRGSAIIIAMFLIAAIGAVAFGIGRLIFIETGTAELYENGIVAYYAAESGIEEGFLRYRFDRNSEIPTNFSFDDEKAFRYDLTDGTYVGGNENTTTHRYSGIQVAETVSDPAKVFYDLRMGYLGTYQSNGKLMPWTGRDVVTTGSAVLIPDEELSPDDIAQTSYAAGDYSPLAIERDNSVKIDLTNIDFTTIGRLPLNLAFFKEGDTPWTLTEQCQAMVELKLNAESIAGVREFKALTSYSPLNCASIVGNQNKLLPSINGIILETNKVINYNISDIGSLLAQAGVSRTNDYKSVTLTIRPLYYKVQYGIFAKNDTFHVSCQDDPTQVFCQIRGHIPAGPVTYINTVGYFGGVTRRINANIDRQSGTLYDLYDYVIFKEN